MVRYLLILLIGSLGYCLPLSAQVNYFVAPGGNDRSEGTMQHPFRTIERAQQEARKQHGTTTIYLRQGKYVLTHPLVFTPDDGGDQNQLTLRAYPGERVVLTSGIPLPIERWKPYKGGIFSAKIAHPLLMDMLLVNGSIRPMARYPNYDSTAVRFNGTSADATSPDRIKRWKHPEGGYLHAMHAHDWGDFHYRITGKDKKGTLMQEGGWQNNRQSGLHAQNRMVENIFEELDAPGEWYYDAKQSILYYYPMPGEEPATLHFEAPQLKHLIEFKGSEQHPVRNIRIEGIELTQTVRTFMEHYEPLLRSDWTIYRGGAVLLEGTENCHIADCDLHHLGGNAVFFSRYNRRSSVSGCHFTQIGASAICFVGNPDAVRSPSFEYAQSVPFATIDRTPGPKTNDYPAECRVHDNLIHHIGLFEKQITGVELSMSRRITVSHNTIYHTPRAGINVSEGTWGGHLIEYNDVFDTVKETGDHGSFNSWGRDRYWNSAREVMDATAKQEPDLVWADAQETVTLRYNRFRCDRGWDIDLDDGSSNYRIYNNLCLNGGIKLREGFYRIVENNILINNSLHPHVWFEHSGDVFAHNLVMTPYQPIGMSHWGTEIDYNLFCDSTAYQAAQTNGTDAHSIVCHVSFRNPMAGDYRIAEASEAARGCGFLNFPMDQFGVVSPRLKRLAAKPRFPLPAAGTQGTASERWSWAGLNLKNVETLGERSATGMDSERGVYVISVEALSSPLRDFIHPNDVILAWEGTPIHKLGDLKQVLQQVDIAQPQSILIFRNQQPKQLIIPAHTLPPSPPSH